MPFWGFGIAPWFKRKVADPLLQILKKKVLEPSKGSDLSTVVNSIVIRKLFDYAGAEPKQLAFSMALGLTLGLFPICGVTVFLCVMAIAVLRHRCHAPTVMLANFVATPVELSLVIPFLRLGEAISRGPHFPLTSDALKKVVFGEASREVLVAVFHALLGWTVAAPFILGSLYLVLTPCFKFLVHKFRPNPSTRDEPLIPNAETTIKVRDL